MAHTCDITLNKRRHGLQKTRDTSEAVAWAIALLGVVIGLLWGSGALTPAAAETTSASARAIAEPRHYGDGDVMTMVSYQDASGARKQASIPGSIALGSVVEVSLDGEGRIAAPSLKPGERVAGSIAGAVAGGLVGLGLALFAYSALDRRRRLQQ